MPRADPASRRQQESTPGDRKLNPPEIPSNARWLFGAGALALLVGTQFFPQATCKVDQPVARGNDAIINMTIRSAGACTVVIRPRAPAVSILELQTPPKNGALRRRGNTGVIYRSGRNFKGRDSFSFSIAKRASGHSDATTYHVNVNVL